MDDKKKDKILRDAADDVKAFDGEAGVGPGGSGLFASLRRGSRSKGEGTFSARRYAEDEASTSWPRLPDGRKVEAPEQPIPQNKDVRQGMSPAPMADSIDLLEDSVSSSIMPDPPPMPAGSLPNLPAFQKFTLTRREFEAVQKEREACASHIRTLNQALAGITPFDEIRFAFRVRPKEMPKHALPERSHVEEFQKAKNLKRTGSVWIFEILRQKVSAKLRRVLQSWSHWTRKLNLLQSASCTLTLQHRLSSSKTLQFAAAFNSWRSKTFRTKKWQGHCKAFLQTMSRLFSSQNKSIQQKSFHFWKTLTFSLIRQEMSLRTSKLKEVVRKQNAELRKTVIEREMLEYELDRFKEINSWTEALKVQDMIASNLRQELCLMKRELDSQNKAFAAGCFISVLPSSKTCKNAQKNDLEDSLDNSLELDLHCQELPEKEKSVRFQKFAEARSTEMMALRREAMILRQKVESSERSWGSMVSRLQQIENEKHRLLQANAELEDLLQNRDTRLQKFAETLALRPLTHQRNTEPALEAKKHEKRAALALLIDGIKYLQQEARFARSQQRDLHVVLSRQIPKVDSGEALLDGLQPSKENWHLHEKLKKLESAGGVKAILDANLMISSLQHQLMQLEEHNRSLQGALQVVQNLECS